MATKKIKGSTTINITQKTKDTTYIIDESVVGTAKVNFTGAILDHIPAPLNDTDDLCVIFITDYNMASMTYKFTIVTIKDYYKHCGDNNDLIQVNGESAYDDAISRKDAGTYFTNDKKIEGTISYVYGGRNNTAYDITGIINTGKDKGIFDLGGNDKYTLTVPYSQEDKNDFIVMDNGGNDKYNVTSGTNATLADFIGKDTYTIKDSFVELGDYAGNDKYTSENSFIRIGDRKGKDTYNINGNKNNGDKKSVIEDMAGNDKYTLQNTNEFSVGDLMGNDKYTVSDSEKLKLYDEAGNDTYKLTNVSTVDEEGEFDYEKYCVADVTGNDKYTVTGTDTDLMIYDTQGKDTYNVTGVYDKKTKTATYVGYTVIKDEGAGKNTFNLNYAGYTSITTLSGTNVYNIKNSDYVDIESNAENEATGSDKYTLTSTNYFDIEDYGATADSYNMTKSWTGVIDDRAGNDTYTIDSLQFKPYDNPEDSYRYAGINISDYAGDKDSLVLKGTKAKNIVFMSDFYYDNADEKYESSANSLILYDKSTGGYTYIIDFYKADSTSRDFDGFGKGLIETIKASKKKLDVSTNTEYYTKMNDIKEDVVTWLTNETAEGFDGNFSYVEDVLKFGTADQKATLVSYFDGTHA